MLQDWLVKIRPNMPWPQLGENGRRKTDDADITALRDQLAAAGPDGREKLLFNFGNLHKQKPEPAWAVFDSLDRTTSSSVFKYKQDWKRWGRRADQTIQSAHLHFRKNKMRNGTRASVRTAEGFASVTVETFNRAKKG